MQIQPKYHSIDLDGMDEASGDGSAEIDDGTLEIETRLRYGGEAILKTKKSVTFSAAC